MLGTFLILKHSRAKAIESAPPLTAMPAVGQQTRSTRPTATLIGASNHWSNRVNFHAIPILTRPLFQGPWHNGFNSVEHRTLWNSCGVIIEGDTIANLDSTC